MTRLATSTVFFPTKSFAHKNAHSIAPRRSPRGRRDRHPGAAAPPRRHAKIAGCSPRPAQHRSCRTPRRTRPAHALHGRHVAALPDGVHFVVGLGGDEYDEDHGDRERDVYDVRVYHVDGTLVHTFQRHVGEVRAVAVTPDGQHIISGSYDTLVMV